MNRSIYGSSHPRHTLVLEKISATSAPTVQTAKRCHVWLFGRLEPLVEMFSVRLDAINTLRASCTLFAL